MGGGDYLSKGVFWTFNGEVSEWIGSCAPDRRSPDKSGLILVVRWNSEEGGLGGSQGKPRSSWFL